MELNYNGQKIIYTIEYGKRKKTVLSIEPSGFVKVKAPKGSDEALLMKAIEDRGEWIVQQLSHLEQLPKPFEEPAKKEFMEGELFLYQGKPYPIAVIEDFEAVKCSVAFNGKQLTVSTQKMEEKAVRDALQRFYIRECRQILLKRIAFFQPNFKVKPSSVEVQDTPTKWGQCSSQRRLVFNWKLIMAPPEVLDYIVVHEMCHLVHMNHDRSFWRLVGKLKPDHEICSVWLEKHGHHMDF